MTSLILSGMTRPELRVFLHWFCGCGDPEAACAALLQLLELHPLYKYPDRLDPLIPDPGLQYLVLYMLDHWKLTEHGSSIGGAWLTPFGDSVREALRREAADGFEALMGKGYCIHGYDDDDREHTCL